MPGWCLHDDSGKCHSFLRLYPEEIARFGRWELAWEPGVRHVPSLYHPEGFLLHGSQ
jgi:hypothetical protein